LASYDYPVINSVNNYYDVIIQKNPKMSEADVRYLVDIVFPEIRMKLFKRIRTLSLFEAAALAQPGAMHYLKNKLDMTLGGSYEDVFERFPKYNPIDNGTYLSEYNPAQLGDSIFHFKIGGRRLQSAVDFGSPDYVKFVNEEYELIQVNMRNAGRYGYLFIIDDLIKKYNFKNGFWYIKEELVMIMVGAVEDRRGDVQEYMTSLWPRTDIPLLVLHFYGLIGALNLGDEDSINYFAHRVFIKGFRVGISSTNSYKRNKYRYGLRLLDMGKSSLIGVKMYFSDQFARLREYSYVYEREKYVPIRKTKTSWIEQVKKIFSKAPRDTIRWVHENVLLMEPWRNEKEVAKFRDLDPETIFPLRNPELIEYYEEVKGTELTRENIWRYFDAIMEKRDTGLEAVRFAINKGYTDWEFGQDRSLHYDRPDVHQIFVDMENSTPD